MSLTLHTIVCSTRPGRVGLPVAQWFHGIASQHGKFDAKLVDLADFNLPIYDEPKHPTLQQYQHEHTKRWSASVSAADAFGPPPSLVNALNYVYKEWNYKPAAFVSYGGVSGGIRAVQVEKHTMTTLKMMPILEAVMIPMVAQHIENGRFMAKEIHETSATALLNELARWAEALKPMRSGA
jgi:NAD(P)H-dependent FMN reductase